METDLPKMCLPDCVSLRYVHLPLHVLYLLPGIPLPSLSTGPLLLTHQKSGSQGPSSGKRSATALAQWVSPSLSHLCS